MSSAGSSPRPGGWASSPGSSSDPSVSDAERAAGESPLGEADTPDRASLRRVRLRAQRDNQVNTIVGLLDVVSY